MAIEQISWSTIEARKIERPAVILIFLGILTDTIKMELRLLEEKLRKIEGATRSGIKNQAAPNEHTYD